MAEEKHDLFAEMMDNPLGNLDQMIVAGLTPENTYLLDLEDYKKDPWIRELFKDENGKLDEKTLEGAYNLALTYWDALGSKSYEDAENELLNFHRSNIFAPKELRREGPDYREIRLTNPREQIYGLVQLGRIEAPTLSDDELAQKNKVLLNPTTAGENLENAKWDDSPNGHWFKYLNNTLVLALYDEDGTHKDPFTGEIVLHQVGDLKLDENGHFYYEDLDGRDVYGRRVLNKMNTLTVDDSKWNKFDFFDSDDLELKSLIGSIMKNLALVGAMWIPGIGPWIAGLSIGSLLIGLLGTLGKMLIDSDNEVFSEMEGWSRSVSRLEAKTQYSQEHTWTWENFINLIGDVMGLLKEQRFIFEKLPQSVYKADLFSKEGEALKKTELVKKYEEANKLNIEDAIKNIKNNPKYADDLKIRKDYTILKLMDDFTKKYYEFGRKASMGYMTAITVGDMYGELKLSGADLWESVLATLGYAATEYALINSSLGRWILPELKNNKFRNEAIIRASTKVSEEITNLRKQFGEALLSFPKENKKQYAKKLFEIGKKAARAEYSNGTKTLKATLGSGLSEGFEEVSEEVLADVWRGINNTVQWLLGDESRVNTFGYNFEKREWDFSELVDRYGMSLVGGFVGGGLTNISLNYKLVKHYENMTYNLAIQEMVYMIRNNEIDDFIKDLDKATIGRKDLSATEYELIEDDKGTRYLFKPGTKTDNQDLFIKNAVKLQVKALSDILNANGANISDNSLLSKQTELLDDLRYSALHKSMVAGWYLNEFNTLNSNLILQIDELNNLIASKKDLNGDGVTTDKEKRTDNEQANAEIEENINKTKEKVEKTKKEILALVNGDRSYEYVSNALFELTKELSETFTISTFPMFAEVKSGKKFADLSEAEKEAIRQVFNNWKSVEGKLRMMDMGAVFRRVNEAASESVLKGAKWYSDNRQYVSLLNETVQSVFPEINNNAELENVKGRLEKLIPNFLLHFMNRFDETQFNEVNKVLNELKNTEIEYNTKEELELKKKLLEKLMENTIYDGFINKISEYLDPIINSNILSSEAKSIILKSLKTILKSFSEEFSELDQMDYFETPDQEARNNYLVKNLPILDKYIKSIENLKETPFEDSYNDFLISIKLNPISISELLNKLDSVFNENLGDVTRFSTDLLDEINNTSNTLSMYRAAVLAASTDNVNVDNVYGYNVTLNQLAEKMKGDFPKLAEINSDLANVMVADIDTVLHKLEFYKNLYTINQGRKLTTLDRVATNKDIIIYKRLKILVDVPDDDKLREWNGFDELKATINDLPLHEDVEKTKNVSADKLVEFERENIKLQDAIYDFFLKNLDKLDDRLTEFLNPYRFTLYHHDYNLLTENSTSIEDNAIIWWIASRAALKASEFYEEYKEILDPNAEKPIAPIPTLELGVYLNYANIINGNIFENFVKAYRKSIKDDWRNKTKDQRIEILNKLKGSPKYADDKYADYVFNFIRVPRWSNTMFIEGAPGTGKTASVIYLTVKLLNKFHPDLLKNVAIVHGADEKSAEDLAKSLNLEKNKFTTYGKRKWMKEVNFNYNDPKIDIDQTIKIEDNEFTYTDENEIRSALGVNETSTPPSLIIIDEISKFTVYDVDLIDKYAKKYGIAVITAGDFDQTKIVGKHQVNIAGDKLTYKIELERENFIRTPKLGVSMRSDNDIQTQNEERFYNYLRDPDNPVTLGYYEDETGIYGTKTASILDEYTKKSIDLLFGTLKEGEKIGFIYKNTNTPLYKLLSSDVYKNKIDFRQGTSAQGKESLYYIIDASESREEIAKDPRWYNDVYTAITRSKQGSLLFINANNNIRNKKFENKIDLRVSPETYREFTRKKLNILNQVVSNTPRTEIKERNKDNTIVTISKNSNKNTLPKGIVSTPSDEDIKNEYKKALIKRIRNALSLAELSNIKEEAKAKYDDILNDLDVKTELDNKVFLDDSIGILSEDEIPKDELEELRNISEQQYKITDGNDPNSTLQRGDVVKLKDGTFGVLGEFKGDNKYNFYTSNGSEQLINKDDIDKILKVTRKPTDNIDDISISEKNPYQNKDIIITDVDILPENDYKQELDNNNESKETPLVKAIVKDNEPIGILMFAHSFNTFELGINFDDNGYPISIKEFNPNNQKVSDLERMNARRDSVNGIIYIDLHNGRNEDMFDKNENVIGKSHLRTKDEYIRILSDVRDIFFNTESKSDIITKLKDNKDLNLDGLVYVTFALKSTPRAKNGNDREFVERDATPFNKGLSERTIFNGSNDENSDKCHIKTLVAIIGTKENGDSLEIPLFALSSPLTLLQIKDENGLYAFPDMSRRFEELKELDTDIHDIVVTLIREFEENQKYKNIINLLKLFDLTDRAIHYIRNEEWTPVHNMTYLGPLFVTKRGLYQALPGYNYDSNSQSVNEWLDLTEFVKNPSIKVTQVYTSFNGLIQNAAGDEQVFVNPGHSFVLVSYDKSLTSDEAIYELFVKLELDPNERHTVKLMYVLPPLATIDEYAENLRLTLSSNKNERATRKPIGTIFTSYKLLRKLITEKPEEFKKILSDAYGENKSDELFKLLKDKVENISREYDLDKNRAKDSLFRKDGDFVDFNFGSDISLSGIFDGILFNIFFNRKSHDIVEHTVINKNSKRIDKIKNLLKECGIKGIYYDGFVPRTANVSIENTSLYLVSDNYLIDNKSFKINGKMDSPMFRCNLDKEIGDFINNLSQITNKLGELINHLKTDDNDSYMIHRSDIRQTKSKDDVIYEYAKSKGFTINYYDNVDEMLENGVNKINSEDNKIIAFTYNGFLEISKEHEKLQGKITLFDLNNNPITTVNKDLNFIIDVSGERYDAIYDGSKLKIKSIDNAKLPDIDIWDEKSQNELRTIQNLIKTFTPLQITSCKKLLDRFAVPTKEDFYSNDYEPLKNEMIDAISKNIKKYGNFDILEKIRKFNEDMTKYKDPKLCGISTIINF